MRIEEFNPRIEKQDVFKVLETLEDNWLSEGKKTQELEERLADFFGCRRVLMVPNGTLAIFAALKVLGIGPGDEVIVPDFTFFGTASPVVLAGAKPVFVDVDEHDFNIDAASVEASLSERTKAIIPVHIFGQACDIGAVTALAKRHDLYVIEDAAQGMGVTVGDRHVGTMGDIGCMSFFADKTLTTGEGGALLVNDEKLADECMYFKNQGRLRRGTFKHERVGYNFRITDMQAAVGLAQFARIAQTIEHKRAVRSVYYKLLRDCPGVSFPVDNGCSETVPFRVNILVRDPEALSKHLADCDIASRRFFFPLHRQPAFTSENSITRHKPVNSIKAFETGLMLPTGLDLTESQIDRVCTSIREFMTKRPADVDTSDEPSAIVAATR